MSWQRVIGQRRVKELLQRSIQKKQVAHAYLLFGSPGIGKDALAIEFARTLNCDKHGDEACDNCPSCTKSEAFQHPNIQLIFALPVGKGETKDHGPFEKLSEEQINEVREQLALKAKNLYHRIEVSKANFIKINSVREIRRGAALSSFQGGPKVFILMSVENMNAEASNSLLKTLEEPPPHTILILTSSEKSKLLPTIISRCQLIQCDLLEEADISNALIERDGVESEQAAIVARLAGGSYVAARELASKDWIEERKGVVNFLRSSLGSEGLGLSTAIEGLASDHDRVSLERWLKVLQSWLRDALMLKEYGVEAAPLSMKHDDLKNFITKFPRANLISALEDVESYIALLNKNIYIPLVLTNLSIDLKKHLSQQ